MSAGPESSDDAPGPLPGVGRGALAVTRRRLRIGPRGEVAWVGVRQHDDAPPPAASADGDPTA